MDGLQKLPHATLTAMMLCHANGALPNPILRSPPPRPLSAPRPPHSVPQGASAEPGTAQKRALYAGDQLQVLRVMYPVARRGRAGSTSNRRCGALESEPGLSSCSNPKFDARTSRLPHGKWLQHEGRRAGPVCRIPLMHIRLDTSACRCGSCSKHHRSRL